MMLKIATLFTAAFFAASSMQPRQSTLGFVRFHAEARAADATTLLLPFSSEQKSVALQSQPLVDLASVSRAFVVPDDFHRAFRVVVEFSAAGKESMRRATESVVGQRLAVVVNDTINLMPIINTPLQGPVPVADALSESQANQLAATINAKLLALRK